MLKTRTKALISGFILSVIFSFLSFSGKCEEISDKIFRLHIIANSNSASDQELKLRVRNRILNDFGEKFASEKNMIMAESAAKNSIDGIKRAAEDEIAKNGYDYKVSVQISNAAFGTRHYSEVTLPAGDYDALRIIIGQGEGKNWWCVMFPPMCLPAACEKQELSQVLSASELEVVECSQRYQIEFKAAEYFIKIREFMRAQIYCPLTDTFDRNDFALSFSYEPKLKISEIFLPPNG